MIRKSSFRMLQPQQITRRAIFLVLSVGWALLCCVPASHAADSAPPWLRAAAQEKRLDYPDDPVAVVLLDERQITVKENGEIETLHRGAFRLLRPEARKDYSDIVVEFDSET